MVMSGTSHCAQYTSLKDALSKVTAGQYLRLTGDISENVTIPAGVIIDLAGNNLSGVTVSEGALFMDSATDNYTSLHYGKLIPASGKVDASYKTNTAAIKRYLTVEEEGSYSFHRFYMGITKISIRPDSVGVGYKATFVGSEYLEQCLSSGNAFGYAMWLNEGNKVRRGLTADKFGGSQELTLRINNFLTTEKTAEENENRANTPIYASTYIRLQDGTIIESTPVCYTFRDMAELANKNYASYSQAQQTALKSLSDKFSASMLSWDIDGFHHTDGSVWTELNNADFNAMIKKSREIPAGHYVLTEDVTIQNTSSLQIKKEVSICLNGHTLTISKRFNTYNTFNICDCHAEGKEGGITSVQNVDHDAGKKDYGAIAYCYYGTVMNLYGGNLTCTGSLTHGGVIATSHDGPTSHPNSPAAVFNMYGGSIYGGEVIGNGGNVILFNKSTFNMYDGVISGGKAKEGGNVHVGSGSHFNMYGGVIENGTSTESHGGNIYASGYFDTWGGTVTGGTATTNTGAIIKGGNICITSESTIQNATISNGTAPMGGNIYTSTKKLTLKNVTLTGGTAVEVTKNDAPAYQTGLGKDLFVAYDGMELTGNIQIDDLYVGQMGSINAHDLTADAKIHMNMDTYGPVSQDADAVKYFTTDMTGMKFMSHNGHTVLLPESTNTTGILTQDDQFRVGYSMVSINTDVKGLTMSGWGNPNGRKTDGTYNYELMATTVAVTDKENNTFLMITVDLQNPPHSFHPQLFKRMEELTGVPAENIIVTATHTHNAPSTGSSSNVGNQEYRIFLFNQLVKGAMDAMADRAPATMKTGSFDTQGMNWSRHYYYFDENGEKQYYGDQFGSKPSGVTGYRVREGDTTMHMVSFERTDKQPIIIVNWRAHPHRSGGREKYTLDADVIGATRAYMHAKTDYLFAYYQGAAGNMNTTSRLSGETYKSGKITEYGNELGRQLINGMNKLQPAETGLIETAKILYDAEVDHTQDDKYEQAVALQDYYYANPTEMNVYENQIAKAAEYGFTSVFHATRLITKYGLGPTKQMELNIFSIGDSFALYTAPAELWDSFGEETEALSPFPMTFTIGYCNGGVAYIPYKLDYFVSYEYFYCLFKQDDVINQMQDYYLENLEKQFEN